MASNTEQILVAQQKVYDHLVKRGKVSLQIAESQPVSESFAAIMGDAIRVSKDDNAVAEAAAAAVKMDYIAVTEEGLPICCADREDGWLVYSNILCVTNPFDSALISAAQAWARRENIVVGKLAVISSTYLAQLRAVHGDQGEEASLDDKLALQQAEDYIRLAARHDASDVHFVPNQSDKVDLKFRIDGVLRTQRTIDLATYTTMVRAIIEQRCNLQFQTLSQQDGKFELSLDSTKAINLRVSTIPVSRRSESSPKLVLRLLGNNTALVNLERLDLSEHHYEQMIRFGTYPNGMIVMTGPTGSGKTTTLSAELISMQNMNPNRNFHTIEDPVEMQHQGMSHTEVTGNLTFAMALRALLRQDPDVILVGEMRDNETAELGYKAAMTGHLVLTTLHTNNAHESIDRLKRMDVGTDLIVTNTTAFLAQRLVRCLCPYCKIKYRLKDDQVRYQRYGKDPAFAALKGETEVFKANPAGCEKCGGPASAGEKGRRGIIEILEMTPDVQVALLNGVNPAILRRKQIAERSFLDLWDDGLRLVVKGVIGFHQLEGSLKPYEVDRVEVNASLGSGQATPVPITSRNNQAAPQGMGTLQTL